MTNDIATGKIAERGRAWIAFYLDVAPDKIECIHPYEGRDVLRWNFTSTTGITCGVEVVVGKALEGRGDFDDVIKQEIAALAAGLELLKEKAP